MSRANSTSCARSTTGRRNGVSTTPRRSMRSGWARHSGDDSLTALNRTIQTHAETARTDILTGPRRPPPRWAGHPPTPPGGRPVRPRSSRCCPGGCCACRVQLPRLAPHVIQTDLTDISTTRAVNGVHQGYVSPLLQIFAQRFDRVFLMVRSMVLSIHTYSFSHFSRLNTSSRSRK